MINPLIIKKLLIWKYKLVIEKVAILILVNSL